MNLKKLKEIDIKSCIYLLDNIINITNIDPSKFKTDEKSHKNILMYHIG